MSDFKAKKLHEASKYLDKQLIKLQEQIPPKKPSDSNTLLDKILHLLGFKR